MEQHDCSYDIKSLHRKVRTESGDRLRKRRESLLRSSARQWLIQWLSSVGRFSQKLKKENEEIRAAKIVKL
jgi:hypothetical protein